MKKSRIAIIALFALTLTLGLSAVRANECQIKDSILLGGWVPHLGLLGDYVARAGGDDGKGFYSKHCLSVEPISFKDISQFDNPFQRGVEGKTYVSTDLNSFMTNRDRNRDPETRGEVIRIFGFLANATYSIFGTKGVSLDAGEKLLTTRCGLNDRDLTKPLSGAEKNEPLSIPTLNMMPWLQKNFGNKMSIWCGANVPDGFAGIQMLPAGGASAREKAYGQDNINFMVQTIEHSLKDTVGPDATLELVVGPESLRQTPETVLIAGDACLQDELCRNILQRLNQALDEARAWLLAGGVERVKYSIMEYAAASETGSIRPATDPVIAELLATYMIVELTNHRLLRQQLEQIIDEQDWSDITPDDLVDSALVELH